MEAGLALDSRTGLIAGGKHGPAIDLEDPEASLLLKAVRHQIQQSMPPDDRLSEKKIAILAEWVRKGAPDPRKPFASHVKSGDWWSLKPLKRPPIPALAASSTDTDAHYQQAPGSTPGRLNVPPTPVPPRNPIDAFVFHKLATKGLQPGPAASRRALIRRLHYDLLGIPPTPRQVDDFVKDTAPDATERLIDRFLAAPRYGERWARHWLDTVHFADTHGCEHDDIRPNAWPYRDYVINSLNQDKPWAEFIREQLAVDYFRPDRTDLIPALGFISAGPLELSRAGTAPLTFDYLDRDDIVTQVMVALCSTTANCARCHDHKFDPISQEDYYALQAVFAGGGKGDREYDSDPETTIQRQQLKKNLAAIQRRDPTFLLSPANQRLIADFESRAASQPSWVRLNLDSITTKNGSQYRLLPDGSHLATGKRPDKETTILHGHVADEPFKNRTLTALRLDVLTHESLPKKGPGRCDNGNLHLNAICVFQQKGDQEVAVGVRRASADWNQEGWTISHAIDGNPDSAWGIYPRVGTDHSAVFELEAPVRIDKKSALRIELHQQHGGGHLIGRFAIYATDSQGSPPEILPDKIGRILKLPQDERTRDQQLTLAAFVLKRHTEQELGKLPQPRRVYAWSRYFSHAKRHETPLAPKPVHVLTRGNIDRPGPLAIPGALTSVSALPPRFPGSTEHDESVRRAELAKWLTHRDNPLFWRSTVNRVWAYHFGRGLCETSNDFGRMGAKPSHPQLLDWLAVWFRDEAKGSLKQLHRLILTSKTWQLAASVDPDNPAVKLALQKDPGNRLLWRANLAKLDAESFRDSILQVSGVIDLRMGGPGIEQFIKTKGRQTTPNLHYDRYDWSRPDAARRSIYRVVWRGIADPFMESMDFPDLGLLTASRETSSSPLQALALYNDDFVLHFSIKMAEHLKRENPTLESQLRTAVQRVWLREPTPKELDALSRYAREHSLAATCRVLFNSNEFLFIE